MPTDTNRRLVRVERELREIVASYLITGFKYRLHGMVTINRVKVSRDLRQAKVYVSVLGNAGDAQRNMDILEENITDIQQSVARNLKTKFCPKLHLYLDESAEEAARIHRILADVTPKSEESDES